ncbi:hypothetical protein [Shewanella sp. MEBiC00475]|uniref:hypothetical protein n=1 Tax=Shewanella sp. MEBiC00475 TaxID=2575361 RepID=UPI0010C06C5C|nr:hypothetical protein [Shewanella sp. MEBiC00475]
MSFDFTKSNIYVDLLDKITPLYRSKLDVNCDQDAEFMAVIDKTSLNVIFKSDLIYSNTLSIMLPASYSTTDTVAVVIFDNDNEFNAAIMDGISCESINLRSI